MFYSWASSFSFPGSFLICFWIFLFFLFCLFHQIVPQEANFWPACLWSTSRKLILGNLWEPQAPWDVSLLPVISLIQQYFRWLSKRVSGHVSLPQVIVFDNKMAHACNWEFIFSVLHCPRMDMPSTFYTEKVWENKSMLVNFNINVTITQGTQIFCWQYSGVSVGIFPVCISRLSKANDLLKI